MVLENYELLLIQKEFRVNISKNKQQVEQF